MANKEMAFLNIGEETFEVVDEKVRDIVEAGQFDTIPTGGVIYIDGNEIPDGFEETDVPPQFVESFTAATSSAGNDQVISTNVTVEEVTE